MKTKISNLLRKIFGEWLFLCKDPNVSKRNLFIRAYMVDEKEQLKPEHLDKIGSYANAK